MPPLPQELRRSAPRHKEAVQDNPVFIHTIPRYRRFTLQGRPYKQLTIAVLA